MGSIASDTDRRKITLEAPERTSHMPETLTFEAKARVRHICLHWQPVPCTMHLLKQDQSVEAHKKRGRQCQNAVYLLESMYVHFFIVSEEASVEDHDLH